jgi:hypothetical protein
MKIFFLFFLTFDKVLIKTSKASQEVTPVESAKFKLIVLLLRELPRRANMNFDTFSPFNFLRENQEQNILKVYS